MRVTPLLVCLCLLPAPLFAQDPQVTVTFNLSADHARVATNGQNWVTRYEARVDPNPAAPVLVRDLGMPNGTAGQAVTVSITLPAGNYFDGSVCAIGPGGEGCSSQSAPFSVAAPATPPGSPAAPSGVPTFK